MRTLRDLTQAQVRACLEDIKKNEDYCSVLVMKKKNLKYENEKAKFEIKKLKLEYKFKVENKAGMLNAVAMAEMLKKASE